MKIAAIIPIYTLPIPKNELVALRHNIKKSKNLKTIVICPVELSSQIAKYLREISTESHTIEIRNYPDNYFASLKGYNQLLLSSFFYESLSQYSHILILQLDAILFNSDFEKFRDFSFIGAPWGPEHLTNLPIRSKNQYVGNGGFSLRKTSCQLNAFNKLQWLMAYFKIKRLINKRVFILNFFTPSVKFKNLNFINVNEDVLWTQIYPLVNPKYKVPLACTAAQFSLETQPEYFYQKYIQRGLPNGCHAWQKYDIDFWKKVIDKSQDQCLTEFKKHLSEEI